MSESSSFPPPPSLSLPLYPSHIHARARVFVGGDTKVSHNRPQKEIITDRFYRDGFSASHAPSIKDATWIARYAVPSSLSLYLCRSSILIALAPSFSLLRSRSSRIKPATIFLPAGYEWPSSICAPLQTVERVSSHSRLNGM